MKDLAGIIQDVRRQQQEVGVNISRRRWTATRINRRRKEEDGMWWKTREEEGPLFIRNPAVEEELLN